MFPLLNPRLVERLKALFNYKRTFVDDVISNHVVVLNDPAFSAINQIVRSASSTGTIYAVPNDVTRKFYIDGFHLSGAAATDTTILNSISCTIDGVVQVIAEVNMNSITIGAGPANVASGISFKVPLRVDNNTNVTFALGTAATGRGIIYGHFEYGL